MPQLPATKAQPAAQPRGAFSEPLAMRVPDACRYVGIGRSTLYVLIGEGEVEIVKLGSATLVLTASLNSLVERRRKAPAPASR